MRAASKGKLNHCGLRVEQDERGVANEVALGITRRGVPPCLPAGDLRHGIAAVQPLRAASALP